MLMEINKQEVNTALGTEDKQFLHADKAVLTLQRLYTYNQFTTEISWVLKHTAYHHG